MSTEFDRAVLARADAAGISLTARQIDSLHAYYELLARWTRTINLTALPLDGYPSRTIDRLLIEPLLATRFFPSEVRVWIDLGTGSGSPAVPLRIVQPGGSLEMIESRERKAAFLREVVRALQLGRSEVRTTRIEEFAASAARPLVDVITMRAVKPARAILRATARLLKPGGQFFVFGSGDLEKTVDIEAAGLWIASTEPLLDPAHRLSIITRR